jgi:hypothetical protein
MRAWFLPAVVCSLLPLVAFAERRADASEPIAAREPRLLRETGENSAVIDAFDDDDPFDATLTLGFRQQWKSANVRRESNLAQPGLATGGFTPQNENVAAYRQSISILDLGAAIGLYKDLALSLHVPIILADHRELSDLDGSTRNPERLLDPTGDPLFAVPFRSPNRSGIDWVAAALDYAIWNQQRDATKPTWVVGGETRIGVGERLHACNQAAVNPCPDPVNPSGPGRDPGISRGMNTFLVRTIVQRRFGYVEPYVGFLGQAEVPQSNSDYGRTNGAKGVLLSTPPVVGTITMGVEVHPYENTERGQRFSLDFKVRGSYHSPGRDYSELFDALGSSQARTLRSGNPAGYRAGPDGTSSVADATASTVYFTGITDQQAFGSFGGFAGVTWRTGEYVRFHAGTGLTYVQSHLITSADACNPEVRSDLGGSGPCRAGGSSTTGATVSGIPNPSHRPSIDVPGRRFSIDDTLLVDLWFSSVVTF